jgi:acetyl-CoA acyltransferase
VAAGRAEVAIGGGTESMSMIPMGGNKVSINPWLMDNYPDSYLSMGLTAERLATRFGITRQQADEFSLNSHKKAIAAIQAGRFEDEIVPVPVSFSTPNGSKPKRMEIVFKVDEGPRAESTLEALAALKPAFHARGSVTAGNSSQTPVYAIPKVLKMAGLKLEDIDVFELNEAFAAQALSVIKEAGLDPNKINPNGGAVALGHPLGCTGAKLTATILRELKRRNGRYGIVTMCIGGGMGAAGIFENLN